MKHLECGTHLAQPRDLSGLSAFLDWKISPSRPSEKRRNLFASHFFFRFGFETNKVTRYNKWERCDNLEDLVLEGLVYVWIAAGNLQNKCRQFLKEGKEKIDNSIVKFF